MIQILPILVLGLIAGVLVNYLADILPIKRTLVAPLCTTCGNSITWSHYLWARRCSQCGHAFGARTWLVNILYPIIFAALWLLPEANAKLGFWLGAFVLVYFGVIFIIDYEFKLILHLTSWFGVVLGIGVGWYLHGLANALLGGAVGYGVMYLLYAMGGWFNKVVSRARGVTVDEVALGYGDVNLMGILGLMVGFPVIFLVIFLTIFIGGAFSLLYILINIILRRYQQLTAIPYGPFLLLAASFVLYFPEQTKLVLKAFWPAIF